MPGAYPFLSILRHSRARRVYSRADESQMLGFTYIKFDKRRSFAGETNAIFSFCVRPDQVNGFGISVVRDTIQYNIHANGLPEQFLANTITVLEASCQAPSSQRIDKLEEIGEQQDQ